MAREDAYPWRYSLFLAAYYTANAVPGVHLRILFRQGPGQRSNRLSDERRSGGQHVLAARGARGRRAPSAPCCAYGGLSPARSVLLLRQFWYLFSFVPVRRSTPHPAMGDR